MEFGLWKTLTRICVKPPEISCGNKNEELVKKQKKTHKNTRIVWIKDYQLLTAYCLLLTAHWSAWMIILSVWNISFWFDIRFGAFARIPFDCCLNFYWRKFFFMLFFLESSDTHSGMTFKCVCKNIEYIFWCFLGIYHFAHFN